MFRADFAKYNGKIPFLNFLLSLTDEEKADIVASIDKFLELKNSGNRIPTKLSKYLKAGLFELRVRHINKISRSLYFYEDNEMIIFTSGFIKKTEKTPNHEIEKALKIKLHIKMSLIMKTEYEIFREEALENPEFRVKYLLAKEKLNMEALLDSINEAINENNSKQTINRRIAKLRKYIATLTL